MDHGGCLLWSLCFCFILFYPASFHPADRDLFVSDLSPYNSVHGPEQIHIAYGDSPRQMTVLWSTSPVQELASSFVHYGLAPKNYSMKAEGKFVLFTEGNPSGLQYVHRVLLEDLIPGRNYSYRVQSGSNFSEGYEFTAKRDDEDWSPQFLVYGDMGRVGGAPSLQRLIQEARSGHNTAVLHVGDFAYDFHTSGGLYGDAFMNRIQDMAARIPYMTCVGNHEIPFNFSHYRHRFSMPQLVWPTTVSRMWYSFDVAKAHFIAYSTEVYFTHGPVEEQLVWLTNDLKEANKPENRAKRPWIIAFGHRPMYCSNIDNHDCTTLHSVVKKSLEPLFFQYGVDIIIQAHEHSYERLWPVFNGTVTDHSYNNPKAPIHLISGAAGCNEILGICLDPMLGPRGPWSAFREWFPGNAGFGKLRIENSTHVYWEQIKAWDASVTDSIWVKQHNHGPFKLMNLQL
ncbi:acid phosphatase type 7-like isoform X1 [Acropora millepora]|uniref:acid phosphatase type 7-like isoform X1 n=1 Tax=Acropora millepora TaxID=45264 RepID=UPI001CF4954F|nr:acid phosphatase type 7-like isoform X1 [Acropora millepora]